MKTPMIAALALIATALSSASFAASAFATTTTIRSASSTSVRSLASQHRARTIVAQTGEVVGEQPGALVTGRLADGAAIELKWLQGGVLVSIHLEQGEAIESSTQSITYAEANELRDLIRHSDHCPVELTLTDSQITQAKPACGEQ